MEELQVDQDAFGEDRNSDAGLVLGHMHVSSFARFPLLNRYLSSSTIDERASGMGFCGDCCRLTVAISRTVYQGGVFVRRNLLSSCCHVVLFTQRDCGQVIVFPEQLWPLN